MRIVSRSGSTRTLLLTLLLAVLVLGGGDVGLTQSPQVAQPQWWQTLPPDQLGFPVALSGAYLVWGSSPTLTDLDGDGTLEILIAGRDLVGGNPGCGGMVYAYRHNGSLFWQTHVRAAINSTPSTADLNGDGHPDVVVSMGGLTETQCWHGGVIALDGLTGQELWTFDTQDWMNHHNRDGWLDGVISTPAIADINRDGQPEIAFGAWDQCIYLLDRNGQPLWGNLPGVIQGTYCGGHGFYNEDTIWSSPALADVTGDDRLEIIIGADISPGNWWGDPGGGYLHILDADGNSLAREWMDQTIFSSPAVADLDKDGAYEFVVGTGTYWAGTGYYVSAFDYDPSPPNPADRLVLKWRSATAGRVFASPAIADLDKDGWLDVVISSYIGDWGQEGTFLYAWHGRDGAPIFQRRACDLWGKSGNSLSSPTVSDVDGDTWPEILFSEGWEVGILNHDGTYYSDYSNPRYPNAPEHPACARDHQPTTELSFYAFESLYASPAVGDLDGDGDAEIVIPGHNPNNHNQGMLFAWTGLNKEPWSPWPTWRHDERHTGNLFFELIPPTNPTSLSSPSHKPGVWSTANRVQVIWSGADDKGSGVAGYSVVWDTLPTTLPGTTRNLDATAQSATSPLLPDGASSYFHLRTGDRAGNWAPGALHIGPFWIDATPPTSQASSPALVSGPFGVTWDGYDAGSGIGSYTIQVRDNNGPWTTWLKDQTNTSATYQGTAGHTYHFRSIARDHVGLTETETTSSGDTSTLVAEHLLSGTVFDQKGQPVVAAGVKAQPAALNQASSGADGQYTLGLPANGTYNLTASHPGFGTLPPMEGVAVDEDVDDLDFYLPPDPNLIHNGDFEEDSRWEVEGTAEPVRAKGAGHTGDYGLQFGVLPSLPIASFRSSSPDWLNETTTFTDTSTSSLPLTYLWAFGDDSTSSEANPTHRYETPGLFTVSLTVSSPAGQNVVSDTIAIMAPPEAPEARFYSSSPDLLGETTHFTNTTTGSTPLAYTWDFGDGSPLSCATQPTHTYATTGTFTVVLTATNGTGQDAVEGSVEITSDTQGAAASVSRVASGLSSDWTWSASQAVSLPNGPGEQILAWIYRVEGSPAADDSFIVTIQGPESSIVHRLSLEPRPWTHEWIDLGQFAGQEVAVSFDLHRQTTGKPLAVWMDEVTLGTAKLDHHVYLPLVLRIG